MHRLGRQHAGLHCGVAAFDRGEIERTCVASDQQSSGKVHFRQAVETALGQCPGAIGDAFAALEMSAQGGVELEPLKLVERAEVGVCIVEIDDQSDRHLALLHMVEKPAAAGLLVQWPAGSVHHKAGVVQLLRNLPQLLDADTIVLGIPALVQIELFDELLSQMPPAAFGKQHILCAQLHSRFEAILFTAVGGASHVPGDHTADTTLFHDQFRGGKARKQVDPHRLRLLRQPTAEVAHADDVVVLVVHAGRDEKTRKFDRAAVVFQHEHPIFGNGRVERCAAVFPVRKKLI